VRQTLDAFEPFANSEHRSVTYTARPAEIGYSGAATQTWVALETGRAKLTIEVTHTRGQHATYPDHLCQDWQSRRTTAQQVSAHRPDECVQLQ